MNDVAQPRADVWRPPWRDYEKPPSSAPRLTIPERREALRYWKAVGVLDERGRVARDWRVVLGSLFDPG